jgi:hypothetical protein
MRVVVKRTGGYAGDQKVASVDTESLDSARTNQVEQLVQEADSASHRAEPVGADLMRYEITIEEGGRTRVVSFTDDGTVELEPLMRLIDDLAEAK